MLFLVAEDLKDSGPVVHSQMSGEWIWLQGI